MERIFRLVVLMDYDLADVMALDSERKVDVQVGVAQDDLEVLDAALKKSEATKIGFCFFVIGNFDQLERLKSES